MKHESFACSEDVTVLVALLVTVLDAVMLALVVIVEVSAAVVGVDVADEVAVV
jgi:hypothetical protein